MLILKFHAYGRFKPLKYEKGTNPNGKCSTAGLALVHPMNSRRVFFLGTSGWFSG